MLLQVTAFSKSSGAVFAIILPFHEFAFSVIAHCITSRCTLLEVLIGDIRGSYNLRSEKDPAAL